VVARKPKRNRTPARKRILLVEDHADLLAALELFFKRHNFEVICACDGLEALARIEEQRPDLIITDHLMPRMTGLQLCAHLRARPDARDLPIILHSSFPFSPAGELYNKAILKASPLDDLHAEVRALLSLSHRKRRMP
jgi:PleD family two-component response regulator